jgi:hypothetical protein
MGSNIQRLSVTPKQLDSTIMMLTIGSALAMLVVATSVECEAKAFELDNQCVEKYHSYCIRVWCGRDGFTTMEATEAS